MTTNNFNFTLYDRNFKLTWPENKKDPHVFPTHVKYVFRFSQTRCRISLDNHLGTCLVDEYA